MVRIVHVGLGALGLRVLGDFLQRGMGRVVGAVDDHPSLVGRDLAELVPGLPDGLRIAGSIEELPPLDAANAAIVTTSSSLESCMSTFVALLERRVHVISSCEELAYPWLRHPVAAAELHERCVKARRSLLGTGVNPGFVMEFLPVALSGACHGVDSVEVWRVQDAALRRRPFQTKIGAGLDLAAFEARRADGSLRHVGLGESLHFLAHYLGWTLERWEETLEPVVAERDLECGLGTVRAGCAAGVRQVAEGWRANELAARLVFQAAIGQPDPHDRVVLRGDPPVDLVLRGGLHGDVATSAVLLNAIQAVREAEPALHTMASIRPPRCQPSP